MGSPDPFFAVRLPDRMVILFVIAGRVVPVLFPFVFVRIVPAVHEYTVIIVHVHRLRTLDLESTRIVPGQSSIKRDRNRFAVRACDHCIHYISLNKMQVSRIGEHVVPAQHIFTQTSRF